MAALARNTGDQTIAVVSIRPRISGECSYIGCVAFKARRVYCARKVCGSVNVARAVDPSMSIAPITYWQLEEPVSLPVKVGLAPNSGTSDEIDALCSLKNGGIPPASHSFEKSVLP